MLRLTGSFLALSVFLQLVYSKETLFALYSTLGCSDESPELIWPPTARYQADGSNCLENLPFKEPILSLNVTSLAPGCLGELSHSVRSFGYSS